MFFLPCSKLRSLRNSKLVYSEFTSFEHAKRWSSKSIIWNCFTFRREVKKEENSFKTLQLTLQVYLRFQPELLLRLLLWLGLVWLRELGDRSDLHAPIFHHYGTAFIHGHEANPIPVRMVEYSSLEHAKWCISNSMIWNCSTFKKEVKKEENHF